ncbi:MAG TPA: hypothetical protein VG929_07095 [Actinomycetota bacterium]|nr:hypothetical protein [Actinomycetota bacterium]
MLSDRQRVMAVGLILALLGMSAPANAGTESSTFVRGVYGRDASGSGVTQISTTGFNAVTVQPWGEHLDQLSDQGLHGVVWLFGYNNETCAFERDDAWVQEIVRDIAGHPAILAYNIADEPNAYQCPTSPTQVAERAALVKGLDPSKPTYTVVAAWDGREGFPYQHFAGTTEIMGLDVYPCAYSLPECKYEDIDRAIAEADSDGVDRYWAILQDFHDGWYRDPSAAELQAQFDRWARSRMEGYFVYHWEVGDIGSKTDHMAVLAANNSRAFGPPGVPAPTASAPSPSPSLAETVAPVKKVAGPGRKRLGKKSLRHRRTRRYVARAIGAV